MGRIPRAASRAAACLVGVGLAGAIGAQPPAKKPDQVEKQPTRVAMPGLPPGTILQPGENPIDLGTALHLAGVENPELLLARVRVTQVTAQRQLAAAQLLPNLNLGTNYNLHRGAFQQANGSILNANNDALYLGLGAFAVGSGAPNIPGLNYNINLGVGWYDFLATRQRVTTAAAVADATRNDVLLRVCLAYLELLRGEGRQAIAKKNRAEVAEIARITAVYANAQQGRRADADRAAVELRKRDMELTQAEGETLVASSRLAQLLNLDPSTRLRPIDGWVVPAPIVPDPIPLPELLAIALLQRPELAARRSEVQTTLYELSLAKVLPFSPNVIMGFSAGGFGGGGNLVADAGTGPRFSNLEGRSDLDVVVVWTFRNMGVGNVALIRAADSRVRQTRLRELETLNTVRAEVAEAHARVAARFLQIDSAEQAVRASTEAYTDDFKRILEVKGLPLEMLDSFRLLARSRYEYLDAIIDYNRAQFQLWVALGRPPANALARPVPADLVSPPVIVVQPGPRVLPVPRILPAPLPVKP